MHRLARGVRALDLLRGARHSGLGRGAELRVESRQHRVARVHRLAVLTTLWALSPNSGTAWVSQRHGASMICSRSAWALFHPCSAASTASRSGPVSPGEAMRTFRTWVSNMGLPRGLRSDGHDHRQTLRQFRFVGESIAPARDSRSTPSSASTFVKSTPQSAPLPAWSSTMEPSNWRSLSPSACSDG